LFQKDFLLKFQSAYYKTCCLGSKEFYHCREKASVKLNAKNNPHWRGIRKSGTSFEKISLLAHFCCGRASFGWNPGQRYF
jgi:hypothetical protein